MKLKYISIIIFLFCSVFAYSQDYFPNDTLEKKETIHLHKYTISSGFMHGGGAIIGTDLEYLFNNRFGAQVGLGFHAVGMGLNYHIASGPNTSFFTIQYRNEISNSQQSIGPAFVFRAKRLFTAQAGVGVLLGNNDYSKPISSYTIITYAIGLYTTF